MPLLYFRDLSGWEKNVHFRQYFTLFETVPRALNEQANSETKAVFTFIVQIIG